jgi:DNA helicase-2/ATP-dependent DNA helicase PcrA
MGEDTFQKAYTGLNIEQKRAVDAIEGPVMVIAGPGTGKTSILTLRIANILEKTDTDPGSILALTFTESGVHSMRKKLVAIIGAAAYRVNIFTFHGFCNEIIQTYPEYVPRIIGGATITEIDQIRILEKILEKESFRILKPFGNIFYYLRPALSAIRALKRENISPTDFAESIVKQEKAFADIPDLHHEKGRYKGQMKGMYKDVEKKIEKNKELLRIFEAYEKALLKQHFYDYEDMIVETIKALEANPELLLILQEEYQYILADEHQDANNAQNRILELLSGFHENPNLFIVGDEKQAIYRFQGASLENFLYFKKKYPDALVINLTNNYRSTQIILDAAQSLIVKGVVADPTLRVPLKATAQYEEKHLELFEFEREEDEAEFIAEKVMALTTKGESPVPPYDIAVLFRDNKDARILSRAFEVKGLPYTVYSDSNLLEDQEIQKLLALLRVAVNFGDDVALSRVLFFHFLSLPHLDVFKVFKKARDEKISLFDIMRNETVLSELKLENPETFRTLYDRMHKWSMVAHNQSLSESFEYIVRESGFLASLLSKPGSLEKIQKLDSLFGEVKALVESHRTYKLADFIEYLDTITTHQARITQSSRQSFEHATALMTAHRSKGLEFDHVFIFGAVDGRWGNKRSPEHFTLPIQGKGLLTMDASEDERRLFYVALTRAKKSVTISYAKQTAEGKERLRSQFVEEIDGTFLKEYQTESRTNPRIMEDSQGYPGVDLKDKEYLQKLFLEQGLNVTAINNFLTCPWRYFFENLVRIPRLPEKHQQYGIAMHAALRDLFGVYRKGEKPTKKLLLQSFEQSLQRQPLSQGDYVESLKRGREALSGYFDAWHKNFHSSVLTEVSIAGVFLPFKDDLRILLRGQLDKLEMLEGNRVQVVDYKTGKPKSRNAILGETKSSEGNIKRQLDFYRLLLDLYDEGKYKMVSGLIDFLEPNEKGDYRREVFTVTDEDKENILQLVREVAEKIYNVSFWDERCEEDCQYCALREAITND